LRDRNQPLCCRQSFRQQQQLHQLQRATVDHLVRLFVSIRVFDDGSQVGSHIIYAVPVYM